jgi:hypothetical protein
VQVKQSAEMRTALLHPTPDNAKNKNRKKIKVDNLDELDHAGLTVSLG